MAMVACKECKRDMSSKAGACPHCGWKPSRSSPLSFGIALLVLSGAATWLVGALWGVGFFVLFGIIGLVAFRLR